MRQSLPEEPDIRSRAEARALDAAASPDREEKVRIYFLPNLLTAGNLACGFFALTWIFKYQEGGDFEPIRTAIRLILAAFAFDLFDGRLARLAHKESRFGREFDSIADIVSFGVAPAFLIYRIVLQEFDSGWVIAAFYLVCGGDSAGTVQCPERTAWRCGRARVCRVSNPVGSGLGGERDDAHHVDGRT